MKKILLTGGSGFIGSHTCLLLLYKGYEIIIVDSFINSSSKAIDRVKKIFSKTNSKLPPKIKIIRGDLRDQDFINKVFKDNSVKDGKIEGVIHFAGLKSVIESIKDPLLYWDFNLLSTINLLKIMDKFNCNNLVFSSSATIYGINNENKFISENSLIQPINPYGKTKKVIEEFLTDLSNCNPKKWKIAILRYFNPIGAHHSGLIGENPLDKPYNIMPIINKVAAGIIKEFEIFGNDWDTTDGTGVRDYIHVMDLAEGHLLALEYIFNKEINMIKLNLGTGKGTSVLELIKTFQKVNNVKLPYKYSKRREGDIRFSVADNTQAIKILKWQPKRDLEIMCADSWNWYKTCPDGF